MKTRPASPFLGSLISVAALLAVASCGRQPATAQDDAKPLDRAAISYASDGLKITGLISKPAGPGPFPLMLVNHGGFDPAKSMAGWLDFFAKLGYVALASDYRGCGNSEGKRELAKGEVNDVLNAIQYARTLPYVDGQRVAVWGISHGAVLALLAASRDDSIRAVVAVQGPVELSDAYRHWVKHKDNPLLTHLAGVSTLVGGTPEQVPAAWKERSALYVADKIKCPVLLIYSDGDKDDLVPTDQGQRMAAALKESGNTASKLLLVPGVNHGLDKKTWGEVMMPMVNFFNQQLTDGKPALKP